MFDRLKSRFGQPKPAGPPQTLRSFGASDKALAEAGLAVDEGAWRVEARENQTVRLFEVENLDLEKCLVTYRARLKAADLQGRAYLEMWCRLPGRVRHHGLGQLRGPVPPRARPASRPDQADRGGRGCGNGLDKGRGAAADPTAVRTGC